MIHLREGYYWVKYVDTNAQPEVMLYCDGCWLRCGTEAEETDVVVLSGLLTQPE